MAVEPLWRWLREDVIYRHCHATAEDLIRRIAASEADINANPCAVADRLWVKDQLNPGQESPRFANEIWLPRWLRVFGLLALRTVSKHIEQGSVRTEVRWPSFLR